MWLELDPRLDRKDIFGGKRGHTTAIGVQCLRQGFCSDKWVVGVGGSFICVSAAVRAGESLFDLSLIESSQVCQVLGCENLEIELS